MRFDHEFTTTPMYGQRDFETCNIYMAFAPLFLVKLHNNNINNNNKHTVFTNVH